MLGSLILLAFLYFALVHIGLAARGLVPQAPAVASSDEIIVHLMNNELYSVWSGFFLFSVIGACVSTANSQLLLIAPSFSYDVVHTVSPSPISERQVLNLGRLAVFGGGTVSMLLAIVQASVLIAHNISDPIRRLREVCRGISGDPGKENQLGEEYLNKTDEVGQLARAFQKMMERIRGYTGELERVKTLNESIVENLPLGVVAYDQDGTPILINAAASTMLRREDERDGQNRDLRMLLSRIQRREDVLPEPARLTDQGGKARDYEFGVWQLREPDGTRWGVLCTIDDVTYKKHMEEKLTEDEKLAYTGKLAADVAHEIRNPLAGIRAGIQVVSRKLGEERDRKLCGGMVREVDRVNLLIENLLNLSRRRESEKTTVSLNALFEELQMLYFKVAENKGILFNALVNGRLWLYADEGELRQVLINLINNSVKAMPDGGELAIRAWKEEDGVALSVVDTGVGMTPEKLHKVLGEGGTGGLGLSIVQRLLAQNGGVLSMDSTPGSGTRAQIRFPHKGGTA